MQLFESVYGNTIELHKKLPQPHDGAVEVEDILKVFKPDLERFRKNSEVLKKCIESNNFLQLKVKPSWFNSIPLHQQLLFTWLGQSCTLFQILGVNFLTDPIISEHLITPSIGPKRLTRSPMDLDQIKFATNEQLEFCFGYHTITLTI